MNSGSTLNSVADPYAMLGVDRTADDGAIERAYLALALKHPIEREPERFVEIRAAYESIRTSDRRQRTNLFILQHPPPLPARRDPSFNMSVHRSDVLVIALESILARIPPEGELTGPQDCTESRQS